MSGITAFVNDDSNSLATWMSQLDLTHDTDEKSIEANETPATVETDPELRYRKMKSDLESFILTDTKVDDEEGLSKEVTDRMEEMKASLQSHVEAFRGLFDRYAEKNGTRVDVLAKQYACQMRKDFDSDFEGESDEEEEGSFSDEEQSDEEEGDSQRGGSDRPHTSVRGGDTWEEETEEAINELLHYRASELGDELDQQTEQGDGQEEHTELDKIVKGPGRYRFKSDTTDALLFVSVASTIVLAKELGVISNPAISAELGYRFLEPRAGTLW